MLLLWEWNGMIVEHSFDTFPTDFLGILSSSIVKCGVRKQDLITLKTIL